MPDYIEKGVAMQEIELVEIKEPEDGDIVTAILNAVQRKIAETPAADVSPVRHGRWKVYHKEGIAVCSHCSFERNIYSAYTNYCPNCGAKMDKEI